MGRKQNHKVSGFNPATSPHHSTVPYCSPQGGAFIFSTLELREQHRHADNELVINARADYIMDLLCWPGSWLIDFLAYFVSIYMSILNSCSFISHVDCISSLCSCPLVHRMSHPATIPHSSVLLI